MKRSMTTYSLVIAAVMAVAVLAAPLRGHTAGEDPPREYLVKAAMIYNFTKFIEWPEDSARGGVRDLRICVLGEDPFDGAIDAIADKTVRGRGFTVKRIRSVGEARGCDILFVCESEKDRLDEILEGVKGMSVLTVSDIDGFAENGGIVGFKTVNNKVRFEINLKQADRSRLKVSSRLLQLADIVEND